MKCFVTGGAGFIGSHLVDRLMRDGHEVVVYDDLSTGKIGNILKANPKIVEGDLADTETLQWAMEDSEIVFHLAANADVRHGLEYTSRDLDQNTIGTYNVLESMRANNITRIVFTSTGSIYGEASVIPTPEDAPFPIQTSLYGASKLAAEGLIQAYCAGFGYQAHIFRLVSVLGERYSHGHVIDFYNQLIEHPDHLYVLGNGKAQKAYAYVLDVIDGIMIGLKASERINIFNVSTPSRTEVRYAAACVAECMNLFPTIHFGEGDRGWIGDNPVIHLDSTRLQRLGWRPEMTYKAMAMRTVDYLRENHVAER